MSDEATLRTFDVLVEQTIHGWVRIEAETAEAAKRQILRKSVVVPNQAESRWAPQCHPTEPITRYGRTLVVSSANTCGPDPKKLLYLDCGHKAYIDHDLWYEGNPYFECASCAERES